MRKCLRFQDFFQKYGTKFRLVVVNVKEGNFCSKRVKNRVKNKIAKLLLQYVYRAASLRTSRCVDKIGDYT